MIIANGKTIMNPLVCDTNIWYDIADGNISPNVFKKYDLIGTGINISEFAASPNLLSNLKHLIKALRSMRQYHAVIMKSNFIDHMINLFCDDFVSDDTTNDRLLNEFLVLMQIDINEIPIGDLEDASKQICEIQQKKKEMTSAFNKRIPEIRRIIKDTGGKKEHRKKNFTESHRQFFSDIIFSFSEYFYQKGIKISIDDPNWLKLDFFIRSWDKYFRTMELSNNMILHGNDFADLFNLAYVQPGVKYTTRENKWINLFKSDQILSEYFIDF